jgi:hypothetical protein
LRAGAGGRRVVQNARCCNLALLPTRRLNPQVDRLEQQGYAKVTAPFQTSVCFYESAAL